MVRGNISEKMAFKSKGRNISPVDSKGKCILDTGKACAKALRRVVLVLTTLKDVTEIQWGLVMRGGCQPGEKAGADQESHGIM